MAGYEIGISGLHAAQLALDVVGNNLANGATEGYHRQTVDLRPLEDVFTGGHQIGQGVSVAGIQRMVDKLLDGEIVSHESDLAQIQKELEALTTMESAFAELTTSGLSSAMDDFFDSMHQLAASPTDVNLQSLVVSGAETLANQLRNLSSVARDLEERTYTEAQDTIGDVNMMTAQIADLNERIASLGVRGTAVEMVFSIGMMAGGGLLALWGGFRNRMNTMVLATLIMGACTVALGLVPGFWLYLTAMGIFGIAMPLHMTPTMVMLQERVDPDYLGRVFSVSTMLSTSLMPLGMLIFGPLAEVVTIEKLLLVTGAPVILVGVAAPLYRRLMSFGEPVPSTNNQAAKE